MDMDDEASAPGQPESRTGAFDTGLAQDSARYNALVPQRAVQTSVLQPFKPAMNAMSSRDYERVLPGGMGTLPTANGSSDGTYQQSIYMRMQGR